MRGIVGLETPIDLLLAVEDRAARVFVSLLIARIDHALSVQVEVIDLGGDGNITNLRKAFPARLKSVTLVGAYDGDMREKMGSAAQGPPLIFLPGHVSIEESFKQLSQTHTRVFAEKLGHSVDALELALTAVNGRNPHDWLEDLAATLHRTYDQLMMAAFECWYSLEGNQQEARGFVSELRKAAQKPLIEQAT